MKKLVLRNSRLHNGAWFFTAALFTVAGLGSFFGLVVANVYDPKALWMGSNVQYAQAIYVFLDVLALLIGLGMSYLAIRTGKKLLDRSVQVMVDETGIHDRRPDGEDIGWSEVAGVGVATQHSPQGGLIGARLEVVMKTGGTADVDIFNLDMDPQRILKTVKQIRKTARRL
jgi:hypothetical protein